MATRQRRALREHPRQPPPELPLDGQAGQEDEPRPRARPGRAREAEGEDGEGGEHARATVVDQRLKRRDEVAVGGREEEEAAGCVGGGGHEGREEVSGQAAERGLARGGEHARSAVVNACLEGGE